MFEYQRFISLTSLVYHSLHWRQDCLLAVQVPHCTICMIHSEVTNYSCFLASMCGAPHNWLLAGVGLHLYCGCLVLSLQCCLPSQLLHVAYQRWRKGSWPTIQVEQLLYRGVGVALALTGLILFGLLQTKNNYKVS